MITNNQIGAYWDDRIRPGLVQTGVPPEVCEGMKAQYVEDVRANPEALLQVGKWWDDQYDLRELQGMGGPRTATFTVQVPDGPRCGEEGVERPDLVCELPGAEPYRSSWHVFLNGHMARDGAGDTWTWTEGVAPRRLPPAVS
jgi:hypothetical protein